MSGQRSPTREWNHAPCSGRQSPVQLLEEGNKKRKLIAGNATLTDQSSFLGSSTDRMEEDPTTFQIMKSTPRETRNPWDLSQDGGSTSNGHSSQMPAPTDREQSKNLLEKFVQMRSVLEKDRNTLQFLQTQIQHDAAAGAGRVKPEPIVIDLDDDCCSGYIVRMKYEHTLRMIISIHGDIAQDCSFTSSDIRKRLLEKACDIYKDLEASNIFDIDVSKMSSICLDLTELQQAKIDVKCLQDRVVKMVELTEELTKAVLFRQTIREEEEKLEKLQVDFKEKKALVEGYKTEAEFYKSRLATLEDLIKEEEEELELIPEPRVTDVLTQCLESWDTWMKKFKPILSSSDY